MRKSLTGLVTVALALALTACGSNSDADTTKGVDANKGATIGLAMPTKAQTRWIADGANMVEQFTEMGYKPDLQYADDDGKKQAAQVQSMIDKGAKLLVIAPVDSATLTPVLAKAAKAKVRVISYDRLILNSPTVDGYAAFDGPGVGIMQANLLVQRLGVDQGKGPFTIELFAGSLTDNNAKILFTNTMSVLQPHINSGKLVVRSGETTLDEIATKDWDGPTAGRRMSALLRSYYRGQKVDAVLSPNDGLAGGIIKALKAAGYGGANKPLPIITGQDAELAAVKSVLAGELTSTIYKDTRELAKLAVQMGNALLTGAQPMINDTTSYHNGQKVVPTYLLYPLAIDKQNYQPLLVDSGYYTEAELNS